MTSLCDALRLAYPPERISRLVRDAPKKSADQGLVRLFDTEHRHQEQQR